MSSSREFEPTPGQVAAGRQLTEAGNEAYRSASSLVCHLGILDTAVRAAREAGVPRSFVRAVVAGGRDLPPLLDAPLKEMIRTHYTGTARSAGREGGRGNAG